MTTGSEATKRSRGGAELEALSEAIESGAGLPAVARAAAAALDASVALIDRSSTVLAVAARSPDEEAKLTAADAGTGRTELRVADAVVGELRYRARGEPAASPTRLRMVATLLGLELERARSPEWATDEAAAAFISAVFHRELDDPDDIAARAAELGCEVSAGAGVVVARAIPRSAQPGEWRARVLTVALRAARSVSSGALAALTGDEVAEIAAILPAPEAALLARAARDTHAELVEALPGFSLNVGYSRVATAPDDLYRAGKEAILAANVGEAEGVPLLAFEETGSYRLLLPAMSEDPGELERFYAETVEPLAAYDEQYETELVATVEAYLDCDGSITPTAERLFTHRHTIRYRLERIRELCGHDLSSTAGREKLGLGLKAMRVLGISAPHGPAHEPGAEGGKVQPKQGGD